MTVVSLASSGGGLPDGRVYREGLHRLCRYAANPEDPAPSYTLHYALLEPPRGVDTASLQAGLTPPYPVKKEIPEMNAELIRRYIRRLVIVYATMSTDGKLQKISVSQKRRPRPTIRHLRPCIQDRRCPPPASVVPPSRALWQSCRRTRGQQKSPLLLRDGA